MEQATMHVSDFEVVGCAAARGHCVPVISKARGALAKWFRAHSYRDARHYHQYKAQSLACGKKAQLGGG